MVHHPFGSRDHINDFSADDANRGSRKEHGRELKGLCVTCANRQVCLFPKSEGGVWHCEEFVEEHGRNRDVNGEQTA